jgi:hypothetical protein
MLSLDAMLEYQISKQLRNQVFNLKEKYHFFTATKQPVSEIQPEPLLWELLTLEKFTNKDIYLQLSAAEKFVLQQYKLELMKAVYVLLQISSDKCDTPTPAETNTTTKPPTKTFWTYLASGLAMNLIHGFVTSWNLLKLIPAIANPLLITFSGIMSILNGLTFYLFEGYVLKKNLGIPIVGQSVKEYFAVYADQIAITNKINSKLRDVNCVGNLSFKQYSLYSRIATQFNETVSANKTQFTTYKEGDPTKAARYALVGFGAFMAAASGYFSLKSLITLSLSAAFLSTPVGVGLIVLAMVLSVVFHMGLKPKKMFSMLNPSAQYFNALKEKYRSFKPKSSKHFGNVIFKTYTDKPHQDTLPVALETISTSQHIVTTITTSQHRECFFSRPEHSISRAPSTTINSNRPRSRSTSSC